VWIIVAGGREKGRGERERGGRERREGGGREERRKKRRGVEEMCFTSLSYLDSLRWNHNSAYPFTYCSCSFSAILVANSLASSMSLPCRIILAPWRWHWETWLEHTTI